jgi:hypothetical protein
MFYIYKQDFSNKFNKLKIGYQELSQSISEEEITVGDSDNYINYGVGILRGINGFLNEIIY